MRWSIPIARIRGIPLRAHFSFLLVLPLLAFLFAAQLRAAARAADIPPEQLTGPALLWGLGIALGLFLAVLLHELAHALYSIHKGGKVSSITLLMIGGVTQMDEPPSRARDEGWMAFVGPLTSLLIGGGLFVLGWALEGSGNFNLQFAIYVLAVLNVVLGLFNLLPAFPMDGGRILRAVLTPRMGPVRATRTAATVGKVFALLFGLAALLSFNLFLLLIAFFVYMGAEAEARQTVLKEALTELRVQELMSPRTSSVEASASLSEAEDVLQRARRLAVPVVEAGLVVGVLTLPQVRRVPTAQRTGRQVRDVLQPVEPAAPGDEAWGAVQRMLTRRLPLLPVVEGGALVGTLDERDVQEGLALRDLRSRRRQPPHRREAPA